MNQDEWDDFKDELAEAADGSKVVVTTSDSTTPLGMCFVSVYNLRSLSHEDPMSLFKRWASEKSKQEIRPRLLQIGNEIVERCSEVPLGLKMLGTLLYLKDNKQYWELVRDDDVCRSAQTEDDILRILKLCYIHLPSHLKQCYARRSFSRRDASVTYLSTCHIWSARGLVSSSDGNQTPEVACSKCLIVVVQILLPISLASRPTSLLQNARFTISSRIISINTTKLLLQT